MSSVRHLFTFVGAEFVQNQLTGKQASKSDLEQSMAEHIKK